MPSEEIEINLSSNSDQFFADLEAKFDQIGKKLGATISGSIQGPQGSGVAATPNGLLSKIGGAVGEVGAPLSAIAGSTGGATGLVTSGASTLLGAGANALLPGSGAAVSAIADSWFTHALDPQRRAEATADEVFAKRAALGIPFDDKEKSAYNALVTQREAMEANAQKFRDAAHGLFGEDDKRTWRKFVKAISETYGGSDPGFDANGGGAWLPSLPTPEASGRAGTDGAQGRGH
jgi:hypothetical protein